MSREHRVDQEMARMEMYGLAMRSLKSATKKFDLDHDFRDRPSICRAGGFSNLHKGAAGIGQGPGDIF